MNGVRRCICREGSPGSGKSALARGFAAGGAVHVELDVFKRRLWPDVPSLYDPYSGRGLEVHLAWEAAVVAALVAGRDVVADRTHLDPRARERLELLAPWARAVVHDLTGVPLGECIRRDAGRPVGERVGEAGIRELWGRWLAPDAASRAPSRALGGPQGASGASSGLLLVPGSPDASEGRTEPPRSAPKPSVAQPQGGSARTRRGGQDRPR